MHEAPAMSSWLIDWAAGAAAVVALVVDGVDPLNAGADSVPELERLSAWW